jgi:16S rRNA processing protein RimM
VDRWVPFGTVSRAHGVKGEVRVVPHHAEDDLPETVAHVRLRRGNQVRELTLTGARTTNDAWLFTFEGITDRDVAQAFSGWAFEVQSAELPPLEEGELYLFELIGAEVVNEAGERLGAGKALIDNGRGQDLLSIDTPAGEKLLPLVPETVVRFERASGRLVVRPIPGLWDIA